MAQTEGAENGCDLSTVAFCEISSAGVVLRVNSAMVRLHPELEPESEVGEQMLNRLADRGALKVPNGRGGTLVLLSCSDCGPTDPQRLAQRLDGSIAESVEARALFDEIRLQSLISCGRPGVVPEAFSPSDAIYAAVDRYSAANPKAAAPDLRAVGGTPMALGDPHACCELLAHMMSASGAGAGITVSTGVETDMIRIVLGFSQGPPPEVAQLLSSPWSASSGYARAMGGRIETGSAEDGLKLSLLLPRSHSGSLEAGSVSGVPRYARCRTIRNCSREDCPGNGAGDRPCWLGDLVEPRDDADCSACQVMDIDLEAISRVSTRIMLVSSDESMLHRIPRYLGRMAGYLVVPVGTGASARRGVELLDPHVVLVDDYLRDADAFSLAQQLRESAEEDGYRVLICSEANEPWVDLHKPLDDATLVTVVNKALLSGSGWSRGGPGRRPVVLFWASRTQMAGMFSELLLDFGVLPVLSDGCFDLVAQARSIAPNLVIVQSEYGTPDARSVLGIMGEDGDLRSIPVLLIGGREEWLGSRFSRRLAAEASGTQIEHAIRELLSYSGVLRPPLLSVRDLGMRLLLEAGFRDRYGFRPVVCISPGVGELALADTIICGSCSVPDEARRREWAGHRVIYLGEPPGFAELRPNETVIPWSRFSLDRLWKLLEEGRT